MLLVHLVGVSTTLVSCFGSLTVEGISTLVGVSSLVTAVSLTTSLLVSALFVSTLLVALEDDLTCAVCGCIEVSVSIICSSNFVLLSSIFCSSSITIFSILMEKKLILELTHR